jgi:hypothetical protein
MLPQLFINYRLKSVAHLSWRAMIYRSLNTFIDDLFAFLVPMPLLHRLACFRDGAHEPLRWCFVVLASSLLPSRVFIDCPSHPNPLPTLAQLASAPRRARTGASLARLSRVNARVYTPPRLLTHSLPTAVQCYRCTRDAPMLRGCLSIECDIISSVTFCVNVLPCRRCVLHIPVPALDIPGGS